jgi:hypothetical protein
LSKILCYPSSIVILPGWHLYQILLVLINLLTELEFNIDENDNMHKVILYFNTNQVHFSQLITGFTLLQNEKIVELHFRYEKYRQWCNILKATINDVPVVYDLSDLSNIDDAEYKRVDFYFKRMCLKNDLERFPKLRPLGFNYPCYTKDWNYFKIFNRLLPVFDKVAVQRLRYLPVLPKFFKLADSLASCDYKNFESNNAKRQFIIQFSTRLWGLTPSDDPEWAQGRTQLNQDRIKLVRLLKKEVGTIYFGGIEGNTIGYQLAPDLVIDKKQYEKEKYLQNLKNSSIGIVTPGLTDSIAWKFGEYTAAGLAILCTPESMKYVLPGDFTEGKNYLIFTTPEECVEKIRYLQNNRDKLLSIMEANSNYYQEYLRPDKLVHRTILITNKTKSMFSSQKTIAGKNAGNISK